MSLPDKAKTKEQLYDENVAKAHERLFPRKRRVAHSGVLGLNQEEDFITDIMQSMTSTRTATPQNRSFAPEFSVLEATDDFDKDQFRPPIKKHGKFKLPSKVGPLLKKSKRDLNCLRRNVLSASKQRAHLSLYKVSPKSQRTKSDEGKKKTKYRIPKLSERDPPSQKYSYTGENFNVRTEKNSARSKEKRVEKGELKNNSLAALSEKSYNLTTIGTIKSVDAKLRCEQIERKLHVSQPVAKTDIKPTDKSNEKDDLNCSDIFAESLFLKKSKNHKNKESVDSNEVEPKKGDIYVSKKKKRKLHDKDHYEASKKAKKKHKKHILSVSPKKSSMKPCSVVIKMCERLIAEEVLVKQNSSHIDSLKAGCEILNEPHIDDSMDEILSEEDSLKNTSDLTSEDEAEDLGDGVTMDDSDDSDSEVQEPELDSLSLDIKISGVCTIEPDVFELSQHGDDEKVSSVLTHDVTSPLMSVEPDSAKHEIDSIKASVLVIDLSDDEELAVEEKTSPLSTAQEEVNSEQQDSVSDDDEIEIIEMDDRSSVQNVEVLHLGDSCKVLTEAPIPMEAENEVLKSGRVQNAKNEFSNNTPCCVEFGDKEQVIKTQMAQSKDDKLLTPCVAVKTEISCDEEIQMIDFSCNPQKNIISPVPLSHVKIENRRELIESNFECSSTSKNQLEDSKASEHPVGNKLHKVKNNIASKHHESHENVSSRKREVSRISRKDAVPNFTAKSCDIQSSPSKQENQTPYEAAEEEMDIAAVSGILDFEKEKGKLSISPLIELFKENHKILRHIQHYEKTCFNVAAGLQMIKQKKYIELKHMQHVLNKFTSLGKTGNKVDQQLKYDVFKGVETDLKKVSSEILTVNNIKKELDDQNVESKTSTIEDFKKFIEIRTESNNPETVKIERHTESSDFTKRSHSFTDAHHGVTSLRKETPDAFNSVVAEVSSEIPSTSSNLHPVPSSIQYRSNKLPPSYSSAIQQRLSIDPPALQQPTYNDGPALAVPDPVLHQSNKTSRHLDILQQLRTKFLGEEASSDAVRATQRHMSFLSKPNRKVPKQSLPQLCAVCGNIAISACRGCNKVYFCSNVCGQAYWDNGHHENCC